MMAVWTTKNGQKIPVHEMTDSHLLNTYEFICKRREEAIKHLAKVKTFIQALFDVVDIDEPEKFFVPSDGSAETIIKKTKKWIDIFDKEIKKRHLGALNK